MELTDRGPQRLAQASLIFALSLAWPGAGAAEQAPLIEVGSQLPVAPVEDTGGQPQPALAPTPEGGFVVAWRDSSDALPYDVLGLRRARARIFGPGGAPTSPAFEVSEVLRSFADPSGGDMSVDVAVEPGGSFLVVWSSGVGLGEAGTSVLARGYEAEGVPLTGEREVDGRGPTGIGKVAVAARTDGGYGAAWSRPTLGGSDPAPLDGVWLAEFDGVGGVLGAPVRLDELSRPVGSAIDIAFDGDDNAVVVWSILFETESRLAVRTVAPTGAFLTDERFLQSDVDGRHGGAAPVGTSNGDLMAAWSAVGSSATTDPFAILTRRIARGGDPLGSDDLVSLPGPGNVRDEAALATMPTGGTLVVWHHDPGAPFDVIRARVFDSTGTAVGGEFQVSGGSTEGRRFPAVIEKADGELLVAWSNAGIQARRLVPSALLVFEDGFESGDASAWVGP